MALGIKSTRSQAALLVGELVQIEIMTQTQKTKLFLQTCFLRGCSFWVGSFARYLSALRDKPVIDPVGGVLNCIALSKCSVNLGFLSNSEASFLIRDSENILIPVLHVRNLKSFHV